MPLYANIRVGMKRVLETQSSSHYNPSSRAEFTPTNDDRHSLHNNMSLSAHAPRAHLLNLTQLATTILSKLAQCSVVPRFLPQLEHSD